MAQVAVHADEHRVARQPETVDHSWAEPALPVTLQDSYPVEPCGGHDLNTAVAALIVHEDQLKRNVVRLFESPYSLDQPRNVLALSKGGDDDAEGRRNDDFCERLLLFLRHRISQR